MSKLWFRVTPWYDRPVRCFLGFHWWRQHPGVPWIKYCELCEGEKQK